MTEGAEAALENMELHVSRIRGALDAGKVPQVNFVGWGSVLNSMPVTTNLGASAADGRRVGWAGRNRRLRRVAWDVCFGWVNGFPLRDILFYTLTRNFQFFAYCLDRRYYLRKKEKSRAPW